MNRNKTSIESAINELANWDSVFQEQASKTFSGDIYPLDIFLQGMLNRTLSLIDGYIVLISNNNFTTAVHLVRLHLDNLLRLYASSIVDDPNEFALKVIDGLRINKLTDKKGKKLTDKYLSDSISKLYPWVSSVYNETSGFIHLSNKHLFIPVESVNRVSRKISFSISGKDGNVPNEARMESIAAMIEINNCIYRILEDWRNAKQH